MLSNETIKTLQEYIGEKIELTCIPGIKGVITYVEVNAHGVVFGARYYANGEVKSGSFYEHEIKLQKETEQIFGISS